MVANILKAQNLVRFAKVQVKQNEIVDVLFKAYFTERENVYDFPSLFDFAQEVGLKAKNAIEQKMGIKSNLPEMDFFKIIIKDYNYINKM